MRHVAMLMVLVVLMIPAVAMGATLGGGEPTTFNPAAAAVPATPDTCPTPNCYRIGGPEKTFYAENGGYLNDPELTGAPGTGTTNPDVASSSTTSGGKGGKGGHGHHGGHGGGHGHGGSK